MEILARVREAISSLPLYLYRRSIRDVINYRISGTRDKVRACDLILPMAETRAAWLQALSIHHSPGLYVNVPIKETSAYFHVQPFPVSLGIPSLQLPKVHGWVVRNGEYLSPEEQIAGLKRRAKSEASFIAQSFFHALQKDFSQRNLTAFKAPFECYPDQLPKYLTTLSSFRYEDIQHMKTNRRILKYFETNEPLIEQKDRLMLGDTSLDLRDVEENTLAYLAFLRKEIEQKLLNLLSDFLSEKNIFGIQEVQVEFPTAENQPIRIQVIFSHNPPSAISPSAIRREESSK